MKIGFFELEGWEERMIKDNFADSDIFLSPEKVDDFHIPERTDFEVLVIFVNSRITKEVLGNFPNLKLIATRSTGFDHIDAAACKEKGVTVAYVPGYGDNTVAEFAFGLILSLTRKIYQGIDQMKETESFSFAGLRGVDIKGKTMGVIGTGRIGKEAIKIAKGFGMKIVAYDPYPDPNFAAEQSIEYLPLDQLLGRSDVITIHAPYTPQTHHLINKDNIGLIKRGSYLVNTARGGIVETAAVLEALNLGILAGAGFDVLEEEGETKDEMTFLSKSNPKPDDLKTVLENHILMKMPNVLITPHNAFNSQEALERILNTTISNIKSFGDGKPANVIPV